MVRRRIGVVSRLVYSKHRAGGIWLKRPHRAAFLNQLKGADRWVAAKLVCSQSRERMRVSIPSSNHHTLLLFH
jgi:hypothetical protein